MFGTNYFLPLEGGGLNTTYSRAKVIFGFTIESSSPFFKERIEVRSSNKNPKITLC